MAPSLRLSHSRSIHHSRRSKSIANNIKHGARKKTFRDLKLPNPGELGIEDVKMDIEGMFCKLGLLK